MGVKALDKPDVARAPMSAILQTGDGETIALADKATSISEGTGSGGVLYTDEMPSLEALLERYDIFMAVLEKPAPMMEGVQVQSRDNSESPMRRIGYGPILVLGGLPVGTFVAGLVMMVGALAGGAVVSNAYIALLLFFGGIGLGVTAWLALRET